MVPLSSDVVLTGCFDGNIRCTLNDLLSNKYNFKKFRACHILPNRFLGVVGQHDGFPIESLCLSPDENVCASISHDEYVKFWNVKNIKSIRVDAQSKSKSKKLKDKKITTKGKSENFFSDIIEKEDEEDDENGSSDDDDSDDDSNEDSDSDDSDDSDSD